MALTSQGPRPEPGAPDRALLLVVAAAAVLVQLPVFDRWLGLLDEGRLLALADEVARGGSLPRAVYADGIFLGAIHLLAGWFRLVGTSVWAARLLVVTEFAAFAAAVTALARGLVPRGGAVVVALVVLCHRFWAFPHWHAYGPAALAETCVAVAAALVAARPGGGSRPTRFAAGALAAAGMLAEPRSAGAVAGALILAVAVHAARRGGRAAAGAPLPFVAGAALVIVPVLAVLAATGALDAFLAAAGRRLPPDTADGVPALLLHLPLLLFAGAALAWLPRRPDATRIVALAWAGGLLLATGGASDRARLAAISPPALVLAAALVHGAAGRLGRRLGAAVRAAATAVALALAWWTTGLAADLRRTFDRPLATPRAGVWTTPARGALVEDVLGWIARAAPPGRPVPVWPAAPMIGFLAGRETAGGFHVIHPGQPPDRDQQIIADLEERQVDAIVYGLSPDAPAAFRDEAPALYTELVRRYRIADVFVREARGLTFLALRRRPLHPPLGAPILAHLPERLRLWPFARVLSVPLGLPDSPPSLSTAMPFPHLRPQIEFAYGVNPERWSELPPGPITFEVWVEGERAWSATIDPSTRLADRRWIPGAVDLGRHAGSPLAGFAFRVTAPELQPAPDDLVGFEDPRITGG